MLTKETQAALLNVRQVAAMLGISWRSVYRMIDSGRICQPLKLGASTRFRREDIEAWIKMGCVSRAQFEAEMEKGVCHA